MRTRQQVSVLFAGVLILIATLVIIQLWLLTAALDALLAHTLEILVPATLASLVLFVMNAALLGYVLAFDRKVRLDGDGRVDAR